MKIAVLGAAGIIGRVVLYDLCASDGVKEVVAADLNLEGVKKHVSEIVGKGKGGKKLKAVRCDITNHDELVSTLKGADAVVNCAQYYFNLNVMRACLETGTHYVDLGGLFFNTRKQLALCDEFAAKGLTAVLGQGTGPGISNVQAALAANRLDTVESIHIFNAGTTDSLDTLAWPYSIRTILEEMTEGAMVFRNGEFKEVGPVAEERFYTFREPIGRVRVHLSLHSEVATLPLSYKDKGIKECSFNIHFFGYSEPAFRRLQFLIKLGLADRDEIEVRGSVDGEKTTVRVAPRDVLVRVMEMGMASGNELMKRGENPGFKNSVAEVVGMEGDKKIHYRVDTTLWPHKEWGIGGGTLSTGVAPSITAQWLAAGRVEKKGVFPPEVAVDPVPFFEELAERGAKTELTRVEVVAG